MPGFLQGLLAGPLFAPDAIAGDNRARPVATMAAVDKDWGWQRLNDRQRLHNLLGRRPAIALHGQVGVRDAVGASRSRFHCPDLVGLPEVQDGFDAQLLEIADAKGVGLGAAIKAVVDLAEVDNAFAGWHAPLPRAGQAPVSEQQRDEKLKQTRSQGA